MAATHTLKTSRSGILDFNHIDNTIHTMVCLVL